MLHSGFSIKGRNFLSLFTTGVNSLHIFLVYQLKRYNLIIISHGLSAPGIALQPTTTYPSPPQNASHKSLSSPTPQILATVEISQHYSLVHEVHIGVRRPAQLPSPTSPPPRTLLLRCHRCALWNDCDIPWASASDLHLPNLSVWIAQLVLQYSGICIN